MAPPKDHLNFPATVLVVDDEPVVRTIFEKLLPPRGMPVIAAATGEEALEKLGAHPVGCVLVDKNLPGVDGLEVMRTARRLQPQAGCLLMTAYASTASAVEALRLGAMDYLEKPFPDLDLVAQKVEMALHNRRTEFERSRLLEEVRAFRAELANEKEAARAQRTEIELFNSVLENRVHQATEDLRKKCELLEEALRTNQDVDYALAVHVESILEYVNGVRLEGPDPVAEARAALSRIVRRLQAHLSLIRREQSEEKRRAAAVS